MLAIGSAATAYGDAIEDAHDKLNDQVKTLVEVALAAVAAGVVVAFFTFGAGAAVGGGGGAAAMTAAAVRAITILEALTGAAAGLGAVAPTLVADTAVKMNGIQGLLDAQPIAASYSAVDAQGGGAYDVAKHRVTLRKDTREQVKQDMRDDGLVTPEDDFIDPYSDKIIPKNGPFDYGHRPGLEWWRTREIARDNNWTREQLIEYENNPKNYRIEDPSSNRSHKYEAPRK